MSLPEQLQTGDLIGRFRGRWMSSVWRIVARRVSLLSDWSEEHFDPQVHQALCICSGVFYWLRRVC